MAHIDNFLTKMLDEQYSFESKARMMGHDKEHKKGESNHEIEQDNYKNSFGLHYTPTVDHDHALPPSIQQQQRASSGKNSKERKAAHDNKHTAMSRPVGKNPDQRCFLHPTMFHLTRNCRQQKSSNGKSSTNTAGRIQRQNSLRSTHSEGQPSNAQAGRGPSDQCWVHPTLQHMNSQCFAQEKRRSSADQSAGSSTPNPRAPPSFDNQQRVQVGAGPSEQCWLHTSMKHLNSECHNQQMRRPTNKVNKKIDASSRPVSHQPDDRCYVHPNLFHTNSDCKTQQGKTTPTDEPSSDPSQSQEMNTLNSRKPKSRTTNTKSINSDDSSSDVQPERYPFAQCAIHKTLDHTNAQCRGQQQQQLQLQQQQPGRRPDDQCHIHPTLFHKNSACKQQHFVAPKAKAPIEQSMYYDASQLLDNRASRRARQAKSSTDNSSSIIDQSSDGQQRQRQRRLVYDPRRSHSSSSEELPMTMQEKAEKRPSAQCHVHTSDKHTNAQCRLQRVELSKQAMEKKKEKERKKKNKKKNDFNSLNASTQRGREAINTPKGFSGDEQNQWEMSGGLPPPSERAVGTSASDRCHVHPKGKHTNAQCSEQEQQSFVAQSYTTATHAQQDESIEWLPSAFAQGLQGTTTSTPFGQSRQQVDQASSFAPPLLSSKSGSSSSLTDNTWFADNGISLAYLAPQPPTSQSPSPPQLRAMSPSDFSDPSNPSSPLPQFSSEVTCKASEAYFPKPHELVMPGAAGDCILDTVCNVNVLNSSSSFLTMTPVHDVSIQTGIKSIKVEGFGIAVFHLRADDEITDDLSSILYTFAAPALWVPSSPVCIISDRLLDAHLIAAFGDSNANNSRIGLVTDIAAGHLEEQCIKVFRGASPPLKVASSHSPGITVLKAVVHTPFDRSSFPLTDVHADMSDLSFLQVRMNLMTMMNFKTKPAESIYKA